MLSSISERTFTQIALHWDLSINWVWLLYTCFKEFTVVGFLYGCNFASLFPPSSTQGTCKLCLYLRYIVLAISLAPVGYLKAFLNPREMFFFNTSSKRLWGVVFQELCILSNSWPIYWKPSTTVFLIFQKKKITINKKLARCLQCQN